MRVCTDSSRPTLGGSTEAAKEYLSRAAGLDRLIGSKLEQLSSLRSMTQKVTASYEAETVCRSRNTSALQDAILRMLEAEEAIGREVENMLAVKTQIGNTITMVQNADYRLILEKRYLSFRSWDEIASDMNYSLRWLHVMHGRALEAVSKLLEGGLAS